MLPEPSFRVAEPWAGGLHESPEADRVVWLAQVHQLVNEDVLADFWRHEQETVVERDVAAGRARTPARTLIADGHPAHGETVLRGQREQLRPQLPRCLFSQRLLDVRGPTRGQDLRSLPPCPVEMSIRKPHRLALGSASRDGDAQIAVRPDAQHIAPRMADADEVDPESRFLRLFERESRLHVSSRGTSSSRQTPSRATTCCSALSGPSALRPRTRAPAPARHGGEAP